jgi:hypothetical protein
VGESPFGNPVMKYTISITTQNTPTIKKKQTPNFTNFKGALILTILNISLTNPYITNGETKDKTRTIILSSPLPKINVNIQSISKIAAHMMKTTFFF